MIGRDRLIITVSNSHTVLYYCHAGRIQHTQVLTNIEQELPLILQKTQGIPCYVLLDVIEEDYKRETLPHSLPHERAAMLKRKLKNLFRDTPYTQAQLQGRTKQGRRDQKFLATAIINPDLVNPVVKNLTAEKAALAGINSIALMSHGLIKRLGLQRGNVLLVSLQQYSGIRQSFFQNGFLQISRLTPVADWQNADLVALLEKEIDKTQRYIHRLRLIGNEDPLCICFLVGNAHERQLSNHFVSGAHLQFRFLNLHGLHKVVGIPAAHGEFSDAFFVHYLSRAHPVNQYATPAQCYYHRLRLGGLAMRGTAGAAALALLFAAGLQFIDAQVLKKQNGSAQNQIQVLNSQWRRIKAGVPDTLLDAKQTQAVVEISESLENLPYQPRLLLEQIAGKLQHFHSLRLEQIQWAADRDPDYGLSEKERKIPQLSARQLAEEDEAQGRKQPYEIVTLRGEIHPFEGDYRAAMNTLDEFLIGVQSLQGVRFIARLKLPLNLDADANIVEENINKNSAVKAEFSVRIVYRSDYDKNSS